MNLILLIHIGESHTFNEYVFLSTDRILVFIAIAISIISLIAAVRFNRKTLDITIKHNKKTIIPAITCNRSFSSNEKSSYFSITNSGFGPAIITKVNFIYKDKNYNSITSLIKDNTTIFQGAILTKGSSESILDHREVLAPNKEQDIYTLMFPEGFDLNSIKEILSKTEFVIEYEDLYNNSFKDKCIIHNFEFLESKNL